MGYPTKVQLIHRKKTADQYYINFPTAIAEAIGLKKGEVVEWVIEDKSTLTVKRQGTREGDTKVKKTKP
jgi:bifunctional DNA-binding transcriptional regulator/antitoxin component of YhaV-PrlF toxin-antitoxin module